MAPLNVVQPALTRTIKRCEERIGARLFDRDTRNVRLTTVGKALLVEPTARCCSTSNARNKWCTTLRLGALASSDRLHGLRDAGLPGVDPEAL